jgi:antitoxin HicB
MRYPAKIVPDDNDTFLVTFPDVPEAAAIGETREQALANAPDGLEAGFSTYVDRKLPIPPASQPKRGNVLVRVPPLAAAKVELWNALLASRMTRYALGKRLGWHQPQVDRLFDFCYASKLDQIEQAARVLGKRVEVTLADAAD